ncbi:MAG: hypothetical protein Q7K39_00890 [Candidatus Magasanikbacteria bacterium]|nr:hypothetical protein [Candidatus Magasanikbacteria bacterium]
MEQKNSNHEAWVVVVDMGYGHQRAAYPLRHLSPTGKVINANNYEGISKKEYRGWQATQRLYETFSRLSNVPFIGGWLFGLMDKFQEVPAFYPRRDLSAPNLQIRQNYYIIKRGSGKDLIKLLNTKNIPLITTFFTAAFMAEEHDFKNDIYLVICDSDISRTWAPLHPKKSRIKYLAPCRRVVERLKLYGVKPDNIFLTGFPLPEENLDGGSGLDTLQRDLAERLINLDPEHRYRHKYAETIKNFLKNIKIEERHHHPLTLAFAVGGAGAQKKIGRQMLWSLRQKLLANEINVNLVAGTRNDVYCYFREAISNYGLEKVFGKNLQIIFALQKEDYFRALNESLRSTDILWTKPSELVFYSALGIPIIMAPSLGSQEVFNRTWLKTIGAGISQNDPRYTSEWLFDWVNSGWLAEAAMSGFLDGRQFGVQNIIDVVFRGVKEPTADDSLL